MLAGLFPGERVVVEGGAWLLPEDRLSPETRLASLPAGSAEAPGPDPRGAGRGEP